MALAIWTSLVAQRGLAAETPDSIQVVLGVFVPGKGEERIFNETLTRVLVRQMDLTAESYRLVRRPMSLSERACRTLECLVQLAQITDAKRLVGAELVTPTHQMTILKLWVFDARTRQTAEDELRCEACDEAMLAKLLSDGIGQFMSRYPQGAPIQTSVQPPPPLIPTPGVNESARCPDSLNPNAQSELNLRKRHTRHISAALLGGALVTTLSLSIAAASLTSSGSRLCTLSADNTQRTCANSAGILGVGFGSSIALAGGMILSLTLPIR